MTFGQKIKDARVNKGFTQKELAAKIGVAHNSISGWENDKNRPDPDSIELICGVLDISPNYLLSISAEEITPAEKTMLGKYQVLDSHGKQMVSYVLDAEYRRVQQILAVSQGEAVGDSETIAVPILKDALSHKVVGTVPISAIGKDYGSESDLFALKVTRDTMSPRIAPGDTVIVRKQNDVNSGDIAVVLLDGIQVVCKQVIKDGDMLRLVPLNSQYETMSFRKEDLRKRKFEILGRVIENVQAV